MSSCVRVVCGGTQHISFQHRLYILHYYFFNPYISLVTFSAIAGWLVVVGMSVVIPPLPLKPVVPLQKRTRRRPSAAFTEWQTDAPASCLYLVQVCCAVIHCVAAKLFFRTFYLLDFHFYLLYRSNSLLFQNFFYKYGKVILCGSRSIFSVYCSSGFCPRNAGNILFIFIFK